MGLIDVFDALLHTPETCPPIRELMGESQTVAADRPLRTALQEFQAQNFTIAVVTDRGRPVGVVTVKDLVEPITGDLSSW